MLHAAGDGGAVVDEGDGPARTEGGGAGDTVGCVCKAVMPVLIVRGERAIERGGSHGEVEKGQDEVARGCVEGEWWVWERWAR